MGRILNSETSKQMAERIMLLKPDNKALWGNLSVAGMMYHYTLVTNEILAAKQPEDKPTRKQLITKTVGLYLMKNFPKGIKSSDKYVKKEAETLQFDTERTNLLSIIDTIIAYKDPIYGKHPFFGPMQTKEWKRFLYKHLDHHLRQFGV